MPATPSYTSLTDAQRVGLLRRFGAIAYDTLLLLALWFFATLLILPLTHGQAIAAGNPLYTSYLFLVSFAFYAWFWLHGGQTLGMRAWRIRVERYDGTPITPWQALLRFVVAIASWLLLGMGFWWALLDREQLTWHDRYSETRLTRVGKEMLNS